MDVLDSGKDPQIDCKCSEASPRYERKGLSDPRRNSDRRALYRKCKYLLYTGEKDALKEAIRGFLNGSVFKRPI